MWLGSFQTCDSRAACVCVCVSHPTLFKPSPHSAHIIRCSLRANPDDSVRSCNTFLDLCRAAVVALPFLSFCFLFIYYLFIKHKAQATYHESGVCCETLDWVYLICPSVFLWRWLNRVVVFWFRILRFVVTFRNQFYNIGILGHSTI